MLVHGAGARATWSQPNLVGAGVGSGTSDFWSRRHPKKWRLRNTGQNSLGSLTPRSVSQIWIFEKCLKIFQKINIWTSMDPAFPGGGYVRKQKKLSEGQEGWIHGGKKSQKSRDTAVLTVVQYVVAQWHTSK